MSHIWFMNNWCQLTHCNWFQNIIWQALVTSSCLIKCIWIASCECHQRQGNVAQFVLWDEVDMLCGQEGQHSSSGYSLLTRRAVEHRTKLVHCRLVLNTNSSDLRCKLIHRKYLDENSCGTGDTDMKVVWCIPSCHLRTQEHNTTTSQHHITTSQHNITAHHNTIQIMTDCPYTPG